MNSKQLKVKSFSFLENEKESVFLKIKNKFKNLIYFWYDIKYGVRNLIKWFPIIWKDRNWNHENIYSILIKKLELQRDSIKKNDRFVNVEEVVKDMTYVIDLLKKSNNEWDNYLNPFYQMHDKKWGENEFYFEEIKEGKNKGYFDVKSTREDRLSPEENEIENKELIDGLNKINEERRKDLLDALTFMANKSDEWWD